MKQIRSFVVLTAVSVLVACATQAPTTSTGAGAVHESVPATTSAALRTDPSAPAASPSATPQKDTFEVPAGYRRVMMHGQERFCQIEPLTGSRVQRLDLCLTRAELQVAQKNTSDFIQNVQRAGGTYPTSKVCGGGNCLYMPSN